MASILLTPQIQILDNSGNPLNGGKVYTYEAGTTTPLASYTDQGETVQNANPVILDSAGRANIWLSTSTKYKITVTTSDDTTLYTVDDVSGAGGTVTAITTANANIDMNGFDLVTSSGNLDINISPHGTGKTKLKNLELQSNLTLNGNDISLNGGETILDSNNNEIIELGSASSAVNYTAISNSATGNPVKVEAKGTDTNISMNLLPKGTGTLTVTGTTDYETNVTDDDDIPNKAYVDSATSTYFGSAADVLAATSNVVGVTPGRMVNSPHTAFMWAVVSYSGGTPTLDGNLNVTSIGDSGVGECQITITTTGSGDYLAVAAVPHTAGYIATTPYTVNSSANFTVSIRDTSYTAADDDFAVVAIGGD